ncbi:MAG TPA: hypothetical protein VF647_02405 [Longimicrobium sp.]|jgi:hypothetical protein
MAGVDLEVGADSLFRSTQRRLVAQGYRVDRADPDLRYLLVRAPDAETQVGIRIEARGSSSHLSALPVGRADSMAQMLAVLRVMHDAVETTPR